METIKEPQNSKGGGKAIASLVLGIIGLIAWFMPIIGAPVTIVGLVLGIKSHNSKNKSLAIAGIVLCIIGLLATVINSSIGAYKGATGQLGNPTKSTSLNISNSSSNTTSGNVIFCKKVDNNLNAIDTSDTFPASQVYARLEASAPFKTTKIKVTIYKENGNSESVFDSGVQESNPDWSKLAIPINFNTPGKFKVVFTRTSDDIILGQGDVVIQ